MRTSIQVNNNIPFVIRATTKRVLVVVVVDVRCSVITHTSTALADGKPKVDDSSLNSSNVLRLKYELYVVGHATVRKAS